MFEVSSGDVDAIIFYCALVIALSVYFGVAPKSRYLVFWLTTSGFPAVLSLVAVDAPPWFWCTVEKALKGLTATV